MDIQTTTTTGYLTVSIVSFVAGGLVGFFGRGFINRSRDDELTSHQIVLLVVTAIWGTSMLVDIVSVGYETSPLVHGLMGAIVGFFFKPFQKGGKDGTSQG